MRTARRVVHLLVLTLVCAAGLAIAGPVPSAPACMACADKRFDLKEYADAARMYEAIVEKQGEGWHRAAERLMVCKLRLGLYDEALEAAETHVAQTGDTPYEARAERLTGHLYMLLPHWGVRAGGEFHRAGGQQGIHLWTWQHDKKHAVAHMERARELYAYYDEDPDRLADLPPEEQADWHTERIEAVFDLAGMLARFSIYDDEPHFWHRWWQERDDFLAETAGEEEFEEALPHWQMRRKRPPGLRVDADGRPVFAEPPERYSADLGDDEKILALLAEVRSLDDTTNGRHTARSCLRQAMLARKRFGMDRLNAHAGSYYVDGRFPLQEELEQFNPWELADGEALVLAGGNLQVAKLPAHYDVLSLLRTVVNEYPDTEAAPEAQYAAGLYCQSRQQYAEALDEYALLQASFPRSPWAGNARTQVARIGSRQVSIAPMGVQLPGQAPELQVTYRNVDKVWFTARRVDAAAMLEDLHALEVDADVRPGRALQMLQAWHNYLVSGDKGSWEVQFVARYLGTEVLRWAHSVEDDGTHRFAGAVVSAPLMEPGVYVVHAHTAEPPHEQMGSKQMAAIHLGESRAVLVLTDLALVEKHTDKGSLYYVTHARSGRPVEGAEVRTLQQWTTYDRATRKSVWHRERHTLHTGPDGLALLSARQEHGPQTHAIVTTDDGRLAWSGIWYLQTYRPSRMRSGLFAYVITDRPVYRPEQSVRFKVWLRKSDEGAMQNVPGTSMSVAVFDPRGEKVYDTVRTTDEFGGLDGEFALAEEPRLGVYRIQVQGQQYAGGQNFRVEEYRKPEFEVTVHPDTKHARLGQTVTAVIEARYYFGRPVTDATVAYRVLREEYTHTYYPPGEWDWLYGPGYGHPWYDYGWLPWWHEVACCRVPPPWWYSWWGRPRGSRARELVLQGETRIAQDGTAKVEIDTSAALRDHPDRDHRYVVQAEVRDASRRVISGEGEVKVTRKAFYAVVTADRGYYRPNEEAVITVRCLTPDNRPVQTRGVVTVSRIVFGGPDNARIDEELLDRWEADTDEAGTLKFRMRHERSGQLDVSFQAPDEWGETVEGHGVVWVAGRDFDGRMYRFNDLELITDKRTYAAGETCHLMVNTARPDSHVLLADKVDGNALLSYRVIHLAGGHTVVDIPVTEDRKPNFHVEGTTVSDARVSQQVVNVCVPPEGKVVRVDVEPDKEQYRPGEQATIRVTARAPSGEPADVQVALSAFDRSILYVQPEYTQPIAQFFHGQRRHYSPAMLTNLVEMFGARGQVWRPFQQLSPMPPAWGGLWGPELKHWWSLSDEEFAELSRGEPRRGLGLRAPSTAPAEGDLMMVEEAPLAKAGTAAAVPEAAAPAPEPLVEPTVREEFADVAVWLASLATGPGGEATVTVDMPENLTTWKVNAWAMSRKTQVGQDSAEAVTAKDLLVRLQAPRFFMERDEAVLSANVHNYLDSDKTARVSLDLPAECLELMAGQQAVATVTVPADGERRVDWRVKVLKEGEAPITVKALTDEESDAMRVTFPVLVHGMTKQDSYCGSIRPDDLEATRTVRFTVPQERRPELTRLEVQFAPSLIGAMMDALPYCLDYPYGCTEQTVSRFLPAVLTLKALQNTGIELEDVRDIRGRMAEVRRTEEGERRRVYYADSPIFNSDELYGIIRKGLRRIADMQHDDGGWSWWERGESSAYLTSYILHALAAARDCDVAVDPTMIERGMRFLQAWETDKLGSTYWSPHAQHAFVAYVLSLAQMQAGDCVERLWQGRDKLNLYGKALLAIAMANLGDGDRARVVLSNVMQYLEENAETEIAWFRTPRDGWWYWYNSDIETNAWCLRALVRIDPGSDVAPRVVKWLLENRRNGYYWRSTRDTTLCVAAMSEFVAASGEGSADYTLTLSLDDGAVTKTVEVTKDNFFTYDNRFVIEGVALGGGEHVLELSKSGPGALYYSAWVRYFTREEGITASGLQLKLARRYFLLEQIPYEVEVQGAEGQALTERRLRYERVPLADGDAVASGDLVQVELEVEADNDYTYLVFEDMKPAGCEPVEVRSGGEAQEGFWSYMELRDEKVSFFADLIGRGRHLLRYRLRAETPGVFHALPAVVQGMYVPELRGNSDEYVTRVEDR
jgi:uncharacterized protein YfaS (alpha-2-macroglobulin family)